MVPNRADNHIFHETWDYDLNKKKKKKEKKRNSFQVLFPTLCLVKRSATSFNKKLPIVLLLFPHCSFWRYYALNLSQKVTYQGIKTYGDGKNEINPLTDLFSIGESVAEIYRSYIRENIKKYRRTNSGKG